MHLLTKYSWVPAVTSRHVWGIMKQQPTLVVPENSIVEENENANHTDLEPT